MKASRKEYRVGFGGDFVPVGRDGNEKAIRLFFEAIDRCVPLCRQSLHAIAPEVPVRMRSVNKAGDEKLQNWAAQWGFTSRRLRWIARSTAVQMRQGATAEWVLISSAWEPTFPRFSTPDWNPVLETERAYLERVHAYVRNVKSTGGMVKAPLIRSVRLWDWLALHQIAGLTYEQIATKYGADLPVISRRVTQAADLVGLELKHQRRGNRVVGKKKY